MQAEATPTWQKNAPSQIMLDSIFAALAALWITIAVKPPHGTSLWIAIPEVILSLASFFLFAVSAEGATDACDEKDVIKYVYYLLWYNFGVIFIGIAIGLFLLQGLNDHLAGVPCGIKTVIYLIYTFGFLALLWSWIADIHFLLCEESTKFQNYIKELTDLKPPEREHGCIMRLIFGRRISSI
jgi:hypothetical protein